MISPFQNHKLEWLAYNQMAIVSSCTAFSYSHWNAFVNDEMRIVVGCKEHLTDKSTAEVCFQNDFGKTSVIFLNFLGGHEVYCFQQ